MRFIGETQYFARPYLAIYLDLIKSKLDPETEISGMILGLGTVPETPEILSALVEKNLGFFVRNEPKNNIKFFIFCNCK